MEYDFSDASQQLFENLAGKEEEKRQITEDTVKKIAQDNAQELMDKRKDEFKDAMNQEKGKYSSIGGGFKKAESYADVVEEVKKEEQKDEKKKDYYSSSSSSATGSRFGSSSSSSSSQSSAERKAKAIESYVVGIKDELDNIGRSIKGHIKMEAALHELERKTENDAPWTIKQLQESHEIFVSTGGGRYVTKESKKSITRSEARNVRKLKKQFSRDKDLLGFLVGGLKLWKD
mgnify:CR=1 FL=1